jgi:hypothetical protein
MNGGWMLFIAPVPQAPFPNQGQCIQWVNVGR